MDNFDWEVTELTDQTNQTDSAENQANNALMVDSVVPFDERDLTQIATNSPARIAQIHYSSYMEFVWFVVMAVQILLRTQPNSWFIKLLYVEFVRCAKIGGRLFVERFGQTRHILHYIRNDYTFKTARRSKCGDYIIQQVDIDFCGRGYTINMPDMPDLSGDCLANFFQAAAHLFIMAVNMPANQCFPSGCSDEPDQTDQSDQPDLVEPVGQPKTLVDELCKSPSLTHFVGKAEQYVAWLHSLLKNAAPDEHRMISTLVYSPAFPQMLAMPDAAHREAFLGTKLSECFVAKALAMLVWSLLRCCLDSCTDKMIGRVRRFVTPRGIIETKHQQLVHQVAASFDKHVGDVDYDVDSTNEQRTQCVQAAIQLLVWARSETDAMHLDSGDLLAKLAVLASNQPDQPTNQPTDQPTNQMADKPVWFLSAWLGDSSPGLVVLSKLARLCKTTNYALNRNGMAWLGECQTCLVDEDLARLGLQLCAATTIVSLVKTRLLDILDSAISIATSLAEQDRDSNQADSEPDHQNFPASKSISPKKHAKSGKTGKAGKTGKTYQAGKASKAKSGTTNSQVGCQVSAHLNDSLDMIVMAFSNRHGNTQDRIMYALLCIAQHGLLAGKFDNAGQLEACSIAKCLDAKLAKAGLADDKYARHARTIVLDLLRSQAETAPGARFGQAVHTMHTGHTGQSMSTGYT